METATQEPKVRISRIPMDVVRYVEDRQRPRETFGEALRRLLITDAGRREGAADAAS